jgi:hypothetical protein
MHLVGRLHVINPSCWLEYLKNESVGIVAQTSETIIFFAALFFHFICVNISPAIDELLLTLLIFVCQNGSDICFKLQARLPAGNVVTVVNELLEVCLTLADMIFFSAG